MWSDNNCGCLWLIVLLLVVFCCCGNGMSRGSACTCGGCGSSSCGCD